MAHTLAVLRVLAVANEDSVLENDRRGNQLVSRLRPFRVFRIGIELPELLAREGLVAADPAVPLGADDLNDAADRGH